MRFNRLFDLNSGLSKFCELMMMAGPDILFFKNAFDTKNVLQKECYCSVLQLLIYTCIRKLFFWCRHGFYTFLFVRVAISNDQGMCIANYSLYTAGVIYALMVPNSSSAKSINISNIPEYTFPTAVSVYLTRRSPSNQIFWELHSLAVFHVNSFDRGARYW